MPGLRAGSLFSLFCEVVRSVYKLKRHGLNFNHFDHDQSNVYSSSHLKNMWSLELNKGSYEVGFK